MRKHLFKLSDLYHAAGWLLTKICYSILPIAILNRFARMKGRIRALRSGESSILARNLISNLGDARTEKELQALVRRHFEFLEVFDQLFRVLHLRGFSTPTSWPVEGMHYLEAALSKGKGVILTSAHFGYARLIYQILKLKGYDLWAVGSQSEKSSKSDKRSREQMNELTAFGRFMYARLHVPQIAGSYKDLFADFNVRPLIEVLKKNGILFIMGDGTRAANLVNFDFLGRTLSFPTGYIRLAHMTEAVVLPIFAVESSHGYGVKVVIEKPLAPARSKASASVATQSAQGFVRTLEFYVKNHPHLYKMLFRENRFERRLARSQREVAERYLPGNRHEDAKLMEQ